MLVCGPAARSQSNGRLSIADCSITKLSSVVELGKLPKYFVIGGLLEKENF